MRRIRLILPHEDAYPAPHRLRFLDRVTIEDAGEDMRMNEHAFTNHVWEWGEPGISRWGMEWYPNDHDDGWSYLFTFTDHTRGVCQVRDVNPALEALGARFDPEVEAPAQHTIDWAQLIREMMTRNVNSRPVEDDVRTFATSTSIWPTYNSANYSSGGGGSASIRWTTLDDERF